MKLTYYVIICLSYYIVPLPLIFHFNYLDVVLGIPILPFNLYGTSTETSLTQSNKQVQVCKKEKKTKNHVLEHKNQS